MFHFFHSERVGSDLYIANHSLATIKEIDCLCNVRFCVFIRSVSLSQTHTGLASRFPARWAGIIEISIRHCGDSYRITTDILAMLPHPTAFRKSDRGVKGFTMRYAEYDYQEQAIAAQELGMDSIWDVHWAGRKGLKEDLSDEAVWPVIRDHLKVPGRLLEAGCGTGQWVQFLGKLGHDVIGVDYALSGLEVGRAANPDLNLMQADFRNLPFDDESFDYIVSLGAIEHNVEGPQESLREFRRIL